MGLCPVNRDGWKFVAGHASVHIYNLQRKGVQHKSMVRPVLEFIALQAINALKGKFRDKMLIMLDISNNCTIP